MSIEGQRSQGGMFSPGEALSAYKLNQLGTMAGYGQQFHSAGNLVAQGNFGTVDLSPYPADPYQDPNQFKVFHEKKGEDHWFTIEPGFVTIVDDSRSFISFNYDTGKAVCTDGICNGKGEFTTNKQVLVDAMRSEPQDMGKNVYYVESCNAYGAKKKAGGKNLLKENSFRPDYDSGDHIIIFLYRSNPGQGTPKLAVCSWKTFKAKFCNQGKNTAGPVGLFGYFGSIPQRTIFVPYRNAEIPGAGTVPFPAVGENFFVYKTGFVLDVQVLAIYDKKNNEFMEVNKGHSYMVNAPEYLTNYFNVDVPETEQIIFRNTGWHAYLYDSTATPEVGLQFEDAPKLESWYPPAVGRVPAWT